jgi:hypothetical protein
VTPAEVLEARRHAASLSLGLARRKLDEITAHRAPLAGRGDQASRAALEVLDVIESLIVAAEYTLGAQQ